VILKLCKDLQSKTALELHCGNVTAMEMKLDHRWFRLDALVVSSKKSDQIEEVLFLITDVGHDADVLWITCETLFIEHDGSSKVQVAS